MAGAAEGQKQERDSRWQSLILTHHWSQSEIYGFKLTHCQYAVDIIVLAWLSSWSLGGIERMDKDTFTKLVQSLQHLHASASDVAAIVIIPLLLCGVVCGFLLARWIFRGGLSGQTIQPRR
jgi:hypothetical protein